LGDFMRFYLISDNIDTALGLRLAGVEGAVVHEADEVERELTRAADDSEIGIVLITEQLCELCPDLIRDIKLNRSRPLIVGIPDRHGSGRAGDSIARYVREAIGLKL